MKISVTSNISEVLAAMDRYQRDVVARAVPAALDKMADQAKTYTARNINKVYKLKVTTVKECITVAHTKPGGFTSSVIAKGKPIALIKYGARQTLKGVSGELNNGRKTIAGAFIATMPNGHKGVFVRDGRGKHVKVLRNGKASWTQLPIKELFGPSVPSSMANAAVQAELQRFIKVKFSVILRQQIKRFL